MRTDGPAFLAPHKTHRDFELETNISLKNNYIYYQVCKAANSTVKHHLMTLDFLDSTYQLQTVHDKNLSPHLSPYQLPEGQCQALMQSVDVLNFTFVRNPYARLLSCYLHRIVANPASPSARQLARLTKGRTGADVSFSEFVDCICDQPSIEMERHWRVQYDCVLFPLVEWSFVGRVERLMDDLETLFEMMTSRTGRLCSMQEGAISLNASPMRTNASTQIAKYITPKVQQKIASRFKADFETFGYDYEL